MRDPKEEERDGCWAESAILWKTKDAYQMVYMGEKPTEGKQNNDGN